MDSVFNPHICPECGSYGIFQERINEFEEFEDPEDCYWCPRCGWAWAYVVQQET